MKVQSCVLITLIAFIGLTSGCSQTTRTVRTENAGVDQSTTVVTSDSHTTVIEEDEPVTTTETTTTTTNRGVVGTVFYVIGEVIAFPFKLIGGLFSAIF